MSSTSVHDRPTLADPTPPRAPDSDPPRILRALTGRRGAWVTMLLAVLVLGGLIGAFRTAENTTVNSAVPPTSESGVVASLLAGFDDGDEAPVLVVGTRTEGGVLSESDREAIGAAVDTAASAVGVEAGRPFTSEDEAAVMISLPVTAEATTDEIRAEVETVRDALAGADLPAGLQTQVTGGPAFQVDIAAAFDGADLRLLLTTIAIVAVLLLLTYRSPVLWIVPLVVIGLADRAVAGMTAALGDALGLQFDAGIVSVLVFGAGTNYALLLVSRYREELRLEPDHRLALARGLRKAAPAILASNATVVLALLTLLFATLPGTYGLALTTALGLLVALAASLTLLPALLALFGRGLFWPFVPRPGTAQQDRRGVFGAIASAVTARPALVVTASVLALGVLAAGMIGTRVGLTQTERFTVAAESVDGLETLSAHFPPGEALPLTILADEGAADRVREVAEEVPGIERVSPTGEQDGLVRFRAPASAAPGTPEAEQTVRDLRDAVHAVPGAGALVGGAVAEDVDAYDASWRDLFVVAPLILGLVLLVLIVLLRALVAPLLLLAVNVISSAAAIGAGIWVGENVFGFPAIDVLVPLLAFLFLVALGIDYTMFLAHRTLEESRRVGTRAAIVRAVSSTGIVITSAGVVLAAVFAALGVLPLVVLTQLGLIVGIGVLIDTLFVRTVLTPSLFALLGDRMWAGLGRAGHGREVAAARPVGADPVSPV
ncbi:MAG: MMPL family transporter [Mobilicoccus sp.]|nr:MMPL family transporter [Mobilicoccus sp.]